LKTWINNFSESKDICYVPVTKPFHESVSILDVYNDVLVCYKSSLNKPGQLFIIKMHSVNGIYEFNNISAHEISPSRCIPNSDNFVVEHDHTLYSKIFMVCFMIIVKIYANYLNRFVDKPTTIYYGPKNGDCPLIVMPHGGPHGASLDSFFADAAFFVQIGNNLISINLFLWFL